MAENKPVRRPSFTVSNSLDNQWKGSYFEKLFPVRKTLFEKFPSANKGLAISGPGIKLGGDGNFSFVSNEKSEKVEYKKDGMNFTARYKRDAKLFDVSLLNKCCWVKNFNYLVKYEERKQASPHFVVGGDWKNGALQANIKINPVTLKMKSSYFYSFPCLINDKNQISIAADKKVNLNKLTSMNDHFFNVGFAYKHACLGTYGIAYNDKGHVTVTAAKKINNVTFGVEGVHALKDKKPAMPICVASIYELDKDTHIKTKLNKDLVLNVAVKKVMSSNVTVVAGTAFPLAGDLFNAPSFGFKVSLKP